MLKEYLSNLAFHSYNIVRLTITKGSLSDLHTSLWTQKSLYNFWTNVVVPPKTCEQTYIRKKTHLSKSIVRKTSWN